ncbi:MAG: hypothetical protein Q9185_005379 [Variospora sp. 1 TL-2023]
MSPMDRIRIPQKLYSSRKKLSNRVVISGLPESRVLCFAFYGLDAAEPYHQRFSLRNYTLQYPYAVHERVPVPLAFALNTVLPALIIAIYALLIDGLFSRHKQAPPRDGHKMFGKYRWKDRLWELNCGLLGLLLSQAAAFVITGALKNATGKPRPDLIDRCQPSEGSADPLVYGLSDSSICTQSDPKILKDGFRSFPSGHSSSAFAGLFYLSLYLAAKMHVLDNRGEVWKTFIVLIPTLGAALIAVSRIMDARHHPFDVITGSMLGIAVAWSAYRQYFPPVTESWRKGRAYPIRTWATEPKAPPRIEHCSLIQDEGPAPHRNNTFPIGPQASNLRPHQLPSSQFPRQQDTISQSSSSSLDLEARNPRKPVPSARRQIHHRHEDGYWSSSSDHHELDEDGFEMQPVPTRPTQGPTSVSAAEAFGQDTSYHPRIQSNEPTRPYAHGEASGESTLPATTIMPRDPREEVVGEDTRKQRARGVDLVETYR